jgi:hypothetical protein
MKTDKFSFMAAVLAIGLFSNQAVAQGYVVLPMTAYANLRHDVFGNSYTNLYGTADLYANLNSVNDDRAVLEFPTFQIPTGSAISMAILTVYVWSGGGNSGDVGSFRLYGYSGDGVASMNDYYDQAVLLKTFTEGVPPKFGNTSFDVTSFMQSQNAAGSSYSGFLFQALSQNVLMGFGCPGPNSFPWPTLAVNYTPVPEPEISVLMLLSAVFVYRRLRPQNAANEPAEKLLERIHCSQSPKKNYAKEKS